MLHDPLALPAYLGEFEFPAKISKIQFTKPLSPLHVLVLVWVGVGAGVELVGPDQALWHPRPHPVLDGQVQEVEDGALAKEKRVLVRFSAKG